MCLWAIRLKGVGQAELALGLNSEGRGQMKVRVMAGLGLP